MTLKVNVNPALTRRTKEYSQAKIELEAIKASPEMAIRRFRLWLWRYISYYSKELWQWFRIDFLLGIRDWFLVKPRKVRYN